MRLTASATWLLDVCGWPFRQDTPEAPERAPNPKMARGTAMHALIERMIVDGSQGVVAPASMSPADVDACSVAYDWAMLKFGGMELRTEIAYGWDPFAGGLAFPEVKERDYSSVPMSYTPGTIDLLARTDDHATIIDWKTGYSSFDYSKQVEFLGLAVADAHGLDEVTVILANVNPKGLMPKEWAMPRAKLDAVADRLTRRLAMLSSAEPVRGDHCRYCNMKAAGCPAWEQAA